MPDTQLEMLDTAVQCTELNTKLFETPTAIAAKIALIKKEIDAGHYQINHKHIAENLIELSETQSLLEPA